MWGHARTVGKKVTTRPDVLIQKLGPPPKRPRGVQGKNRFVIALSFKFLRNLGCSLFFFCYRETLHSLEKELRKDHHKSRILKHHKDLVLLLTYVLQYFVKHEYGFVWIHVFSVLAV